MKRVLRIFHGLDTRVVGVVVVGLMLRGLRILAEPVWGEEVVYVQIAGMSIGDILLVRHWLVDHPQLYLLISHYWSLFSLSGWWLRLPSLFAYLASSYILNKIVERLYRSELSKLGVMAFYALFPYFVGLEWQAVPYAFAIMFFFMSLLACLRVFDGGFVGRNGLWLVISLSLWLYTSFESVYFVGLLFAFSFFMTLLKVLSKKFLVSLVKVLMVVGVVFLPEMIVVLIRMSELQRLSGGISWYSEGIFRFILSLFMPMVSWKVAGLLFTGLFGYLSWRMLKLKMGVSWWFVWFVVIGTWGILSVLGDNFMDVRHPRAFYYLIMAAVMLFLGVLEQGWEYFRARMILMGVGGLVVVCMLVGYVRSPRLVLATYGYHRLGMDFGRVRGSLLELLGGEGGEDLRVVLDDSVKMESWYDAAALYDYYLRCYDLSRVRWGECGLIQERRLQGDWSEEEFDKQKLYLGVFGVTSSHNLFVDSCIEKEINCLVWEEELGRFEEL